MPELSRALAPVRLAVGTKGYAKALAHHFPKMPSQSIDYGVMEKASNVAVVPGDFGWSDVGSFAALPEVRPLDGAGNVVTGKGAVALECEGSVVVAAGRPVAVVGMKDVVVVDAGDAVLVVPREKCQDVRKAVEALKARKWDRFL
jgi:mannose-1-phosphate guanylyltransferase